MIIPCYRCGKGINTPSELNADYVIAEDTKEIELEADSTPREVQKTGIICPECYRPTDFVIWGVHK